MRVLFFINGFHLGGKERQLIELLKYLRANCQDPPMVAVMSRDMKYPEVFDLGIEIRYLIRKTKRDPFILREFNRLCSEYRPEVIHVLDAMTAIYAVPIALLRRIPLVNCMIVDAPEYIGPGTGAWLRSKLTFPFSTAIVANSRAGLRTYRAPGRKSLCIYNGFDFKRSRSLGDPREVRDRLGIGGKKIVGMVGEVAVRKDFETFVRAASIVIRRRNDVAFVAVGDGPKLDHVKSLVDPAARDHIHFTGWRKDVESIVNTFDVGVLSTFTEGISNSIMEYMAMGKPVVATDGGGTNELVVDGETGYLVQRKNVEQTVEKITRLLDNADEARAMGERGRKRIEEIFNLDAMGRQYLELYRGLIDRSFPPRGSS